MTDWLKIADDLNGKVPWQGSSMCGTVLVLEGKKLEKLPELDDEHAAQEFSRVTGVADGICAEGIAQIRAALEAWPPEPPTRPDAPSAAPSAPPGPPPAEAAPSEPPPESVAEPEPPPESVAEPEPPPESRSEPDLELYGPGGMTEATINSMGVVELRELAEKMEVPDSAKLTKGELVEALLGVLRD